MLAWCCTRTALVQKTWHGHCFAVWRCHIGSVCITKNLSAYWEKHLMQIKHAVKGAALAAMMAAAPSAFAGATGNVYASSEYMFRGIAQTGGAAISGGLDYGWDSGLYVGTWASNIGFGGGTEQDLYVGFGGEAGGLAYDVGMTYYWYPEEDESGSEYSTLEFYASLGFGPATLSLAYSDELQFFNGVAAGAADAKEGLYINLAASFPLTQTLGLHVAIGQYSGDEIEAGLVTEDSYLDFHVGVSAELEGGYSASFAYIFTDIDDASPYLGNVDDDPKFVVSIGKDFDL